MAKITLEISDRLLREAADLAGREGTTLRILVEEGLRSVVTERRLLASPFRLRNASFRGNGLNPDLSGETREIWSLAYEGRGG